MRAYAAALIPDNRGGDGSDVMGAEGLGRRAAESCTVESNRLLTVGALLGAPEERRFLRADGGRGGGGLNDRGRNGSERQRIPLAFRRSERVAANQGVRLCEDGAAIRDDATPDGQAPDCQGHGLAFGEGRR